MIFVTVGTQFFDDLIEEVDRLAAAGAFEGPVFAQIGLSKYQPTHVDHAPFVPNFVDRARQSSLVIAHAGTGSLCELITLQVPFIAVANQIKAGNHQIEFLHELSTLYDFCWIESPKALCDALPRARVAKSLTNARPASLSSDIRAYLQEALSL